MLGDERSPLLVWELCEAKRDRESALQKSGSESSASESAGVGNRAQNESSDSECWRASQASTLSSGLGEEGGNAGEVTSCGTPRRDRFLSHPKIGPGFRRAQGSGLL